MNDTNAEAAKIQLDILRKLTGAERLQLAIEMSSLARELALTRLRGEHPDWSDHDLKCEILRYAFGSAPLPPLLR